MWRCGHNRCRSLFIFYKELGEVNWLLVAYSSDLVHFVQVQSHCKVERQRGRDWPFLQEILFVYITTLQKDVLMAEVSARTATDINDICMFDKKPYNLQLCGQWASMYNTRTLTLKLKQIYEIKPQTTPLPLPYLVSVSPIILLFNMTFYLINLGYRQVLLRFIFVLLHHLLVFLFRCWIEKCCIV